VITPDAQTVNTRPPAPTEIAAALAHPTDCDLFYSMALITDRRYRDALPAQAWLTQWIALQIDPSVRPTVDPELIDWTTHVPFDRQRQWAKDSMQFLTSCELQKLSVPTPG
jgi:hypothetical protein